MDFLSKPIGVRIMEKFKHIRDVTLIKNAFPMEWRDEFMELLNHPNEDWIRYPNNIKYGILYEGPKISKTPLGDRWRNYAFDKWKDKFGIENKLNEGYENLNGVYWGDFLLEFKEGHYLIPHTDAHNPTEFRFNVLLQKSEQGGIYKFNGKELHMDEGDMVVFSPYHNLHQTDKIIGTRSRVLLSLSFIQKEQKNVL
jgi:hypothetical protein